MKFIVMSARVQWLIFQICKVGKWDISAHANSAIVRNLRVNVLDVRRNNNIRINYSKNVL